MGLSTIKTRNWDDELIVDCDELDSKLKTKRNTVPGEDNITYEQIKQSTVELRFTIYDLLTSCINIGIIPETWKHAKIVKREQRPQRRKKLPTYQSNTLPGETTTKTRLTKHCERNRIIRENRTASKKSRCMTDNLTKVTEIIAKGLKTKSQTATVFLHVEKDFDSVHHKTLMQKLHD